MAFYDSDGVVRREVDAIDASSEHFNYSRSTCVTQLSTVVMLVFAGIFSDAEVLLAC